MSWRGDSLLLASGSEDGQLIVWNVMDGFPMAAYSGSFALDIATRAMPAATALAPAGALIYRSTASGTC